jgi:ABC-type cobalamin/Fe3+-siderophores transport system ATPase subunit
MRVKKDSESANIPDSNPDMIIKKIQISNCILNEKEIEVSFNPQMTTIIGGRGSGKSSIIRTIAGAMNSFSGENLNIISDEQKNFYKENGKTKNSAIKKGIFKENSSIILIIERLNDLYKIEVTDIKTMENQTRKLYKWIDERWELVEDENFLNLFKAQIFTQKQIYELAMDSNSLMAIIDADIKELPKCVLEKETTLNNLVSKALDISNNKREISEKPKLETELADIENQISKYEKSGISDTLKQKQRFDDQKQVISSYIEMKKNKIEEIKKYLDNVVVSYKEVEDTELKTLFEEDLNAFQDNVNRLKQTCNEMLLNVDRFSEKIDKSEWNKKKIAIQDKYNSSMKELQENGLDTVKLGELMEQRNKKKNEIDRILWKEGELSKQETEYDSLQCEYKSKVEKIYTLRNHFIQKVIGEDKNVKFNLGRNRSRSSFINYLKQAINKDIATVDDDIKKLADIYFDKDGPEKYRNLLKNIRNKEAINLLSKKTKDVITDMTDDTFTRMITFLPDDDLNVSYRPEKSKKFIPLSNASAGQKTTTILTFLLSYGNQPLLLDQPEDDLDNRLVYDLIVARLKVAKSKRQIIVVTHNANIPVNGDSEYIVSMDSETDIIHVKDTGTMDDEKIRREICDVMEGTKDAFEMRAKKYHFNIKE